MSGAVACALLLAGLAPGAGAARLVGRNATQGAASGAEAVQAMSDLCDSACGEGADVSCAPNCEVEMRACASKGAKEVEACKAEARARFEGEQKQWNATHFLGRRTQISKDKKKKAKEMCLKACGPSPTVDSSCVPSCQVKVYECIFVGPEGFGMPLKEEAKAKQLELEEQCTAEVLKRYSEFEDKWDKNGPGAVPWP